MPARSPIPENRLKELAAYGRTKWEGLEHQRYLCVWLRAEKGKTSAEIADILDCHPVTVRAIQRDFIARGTVVFRDENNGGRRNQMMTEAEETAFLDGFAAVAATASILVVSDIKAALEEKVGHSVHKTTVYRLLKRHDWRKVVPRPRHPKRDEEAAEAFKKGALRKGSPKRTPRAGR